MALFRVGQTVSSGDVLKANARGEHVLSGAVGQRLNVWQSADSTAPVVEVLVPETVKKVAVFHGVPVIIDSKTTITIDSANVSADELAAYLETPGVSARCVRCVAVAEPPLMKARVLEVSSEKTTRAVAGGVPWPSGGPDGWCQKILESREEYWLDFKTNSATVRGTLVSAQSNEGHPPSGEVAVLDCLDGCVIYHLVEVTMTSRQLQQPPDPGRLELRLQAGTVVLAP